MELNRGVRRLTAIAACVLLAALCLVPAISWGVEAPSQDREWTFDLTKSDALKQIHDQYGLNGVQGASVDYDDLHIDATASGAKFNPRESGDTQINSGTTFTFTVPASSYEASVSLVPNSSAIAADVTINGTTSSHLSESGQALSFSVPAGDEATQVTITFTANTYLYRMSMIFERPYPGEPEDVTALDKVWDLASLDANDDSLVFKGTRGELDGLLIDAEDGKFDPTGTSVQVNIGTTIYVPVATDPDGAVLTVAYNANGNEILVNGSPVPADGRVELTAEEPAYIAIKVVAPASGDTSHSSYLSAISVDYASDTSTYPGTPENVTATDVTWNLAADDDAADPRPAVNAGERADWRGMRIDAMAGGAKFGPRSGEGGNDTQVGNGTVLYVPLAPDAQGATLRLEGNNYNNLLITVDGDVQRLGTDIALNTADAPRYVKIEFSLPAEAEESSGSCYLTSIALDYATDDAQSYHVVTVGANGTYQTINEALAAETSSLKDHLVISIAPGDYYERVVVSQPGVIFQNADPTNEQPVVIRASYYSSNTFAADGTYLPQDDHDLGTDQSATVLIEASGTGFTAWGITFQNDYNVVDHTAEGEQTPAVAFNSKADKINLEHCCFIGRQDTLYLQGAGNRVYLNDCYVEGTVDFIFGDADALIESSTLHMAAFTGRDSGYYTAANTKTGYTGMVFANCALTADPSVTDVSLGRPWQNLAYYSGTSRTRTGSTVYHDLDTSKPHPDYASVSSAVTFVGCTMPATLKAEHWDRWMGHVPDQEESVSVTYDATVRFNEVSCAYPGGAPDADALVLGKVSSEDVDQKLDELRASMHIGSAYNWDPASFTRVADRSVAGGWAEEPQGPQGAPSGSGASDGSGNNDVLAATGDTVLFAAVAALGGLALVGSGVLSRRRES